MDLTEARQEIDGINRQILDLFKKRMEAVRAVAEDKKKTGTPIFNGQREREILADVAEAAGEELETYAKILFQTLMDVSRSYQTRLFDRQGSISLKIKEAVAATPAIFPNKGTVACQGVEGAYSQIAADRLFGLQKILYFKDFEGVFAAVQSGLCSYGVLPIENSTYGTVNEVYDLMQKHRFSIVRSLKLRIDHKLLTKPGVELSEITEVFSHAQAIGQCGRFLAEHPNIKVTVCENTAVAAKRVADSDRRDVAAIASASCARLYGLSPLPVHVANNDGNYTRFICISKEGQIFPGANRVSLTVTVPNTPGSLYYLLAKFCAEGFNLTKLENRPIEGSDFDVRFYFDFEAPVLSERALALLDDLEASCESFTFLGGYAEV